MKEMETGRGNTSIYTLNLANLIELKQLKYT